MSADPHNSPGHQQQSPVSTSPSKTNSPSGITLNTTVQIIQVNKTVIIINMLGQGKQKFPFLCQTP